jgi:hypothetical protein
MSVDEIKELDIHKQRFMYHSLTCTGTSLASCFIFSILSKRYISMKTWVKFPITAAIFVGSLAFTMPPAFEELGDRYGEVIEAHKEHVNRETICAYFEIDKSIDYHKAHMNQMEEVMRFKESLDK